MAACYGCKAVCSSIPECRQQLWAQKTEVFEQKVYRAHLQVTQWYSALSAPPPLNAVDYGWEADEANNSASPTKYGRRSTLYAPEKILKLVKYGCVSERPCKGANCGCMEHQLPCSMFCACGGGRAYLNAF